MPENIDLLNNSIDYLRGYLDGFVYPRSDQTKGIRVPDFEKPAPTGKKRISLPEPSTVRIANNDIFTCINKRRSHRVFSDSEITVEELSFLLWATQGVKSHADDMRHQHHAVRRTVPSAGSRHPFETYVAINHVAGLEKGIYRYLASKHCLVSESNPDDLSDKISAGALGQCFCGAAPVFFLWSVIPYRTIWRYGLPMSIKAITLDAGHIGQNLHLACEALDLGTCMIGAYSQSAMDELFGLDGKDEFAFYMAPVGRIKA
ncbi:MAG: SagB/ThcOx family dehydrogenase [Candidatus Riflebacteria bacterium]|nr:SagB/ThcOx family dehydrogenase [Candidatus Riflebacteria bacterium]